VSLGFPASDAVLYVYVLAQFTAQRCPICLSPRDSKFGLNDEFFHLDIRSSLTACTVRLLPFYISEDFRQLHQY
jgi:hypothetical protein